MNGLLLDTHALIWYSANAPFLSRAAHAAITSAGANNFVSAASVYEAEFKERTGRSLGLPEAVNEIVRQQGFQSLPISLDHAARAASFAHAHRDPWDRVIAAQAIAEGLAVVTKDAEIAALGARVVW